MGTYRMAQVCPNGHVATSSADSSPELREEYCSDCGEKTITHCPECNSSIRGDYHVEMVLSFGKYTPPSFCHNCGSPFPWTYRKIDAAVELAEITSNLSNDEVTQFRSDLEELTKNSPKAQVSAYRFKETMKKVGSATASGVRDIVVDVLSETAKKVIWG